MKRPTGDWRYLVRLCPRRACSAPVALIAVIAFLACGPATAVAQTPNLFDGLETVETAGPTEIAPDADGADTVAAPVVDTSANVAPSGFGSESLMVQGGDRVMGTQPRLAGSELAITEPAVTEPGLTDHAVADSAVTDPAVAEALAIIAAQTCVLQHPDGTDAAVLQAAAAALDTAVAQLQSKAPNQAAAARLESAMVAVRSALAEPVAVQTTAIGWRVWQYLTVKQRRATAQAALVATVEKPRDEALKEDPMADDQDALAARAQRQLERHRLGTSGSTAGRVHRQTDPFTFPKDHGGHASVCEWWYWNGHFGTAAGRPTYGFELCFFKALEGVLVCHVAVTDVANQQFHYDRYFCTLLDGRIKRDQLDMRFRRRDLKLLQRDRVNWAKGVDAAAANRHAHVIHGEVGPAVFEFQLALADGKVPLPINGDGIIDMPEGGDSWYYSLTRLALQGSFQCKGPDGTTTKQQVVGQAWMDHQWGQFYVLHQGWDWYSFQMDDGSEYNLFAMRRNVSPMVRYGEPSAQTFANAVDARGRRRHAGGLATPHHVEVRPLEFWKGRTGTFAAQWEVVVHPWNERFLVRARAKNQEVGAKIPDPLPTYWEGGCDVWRRNADGSLTRGLSYVEHMPYPSSFKVMQPTGDWSDI